MATDETWLRMLAFPALAVALLLLAVCVWRLVRALRSREIATLPLVAEQVVDVPEGYVVLCGEGPFLSTAFGQLRYALTGATHGIEAPGRRIWFRSNQSSFSRARISLWRFRVEQPGPYRLRVEALDPGRDYGDCGLVLRRPFGLGVVGALLGTVLSAVASVAALVLVLFTVVGTGSDVSTPAPRPALDLATPLRGGVLVVADATLVARWRDVAWPEQRVVLRIPAEWQERKRTDRTLDLRPPEPVGSYVIVDVTPANLGGPPEHLNRVLLKAAADQFGRGEIAGYETRLVGRSLGVLSISAPDAEGAALRWSAYVGSDAAQRMVTILLSLRGMDGTKGLAILAAVLDSVRID